MKALLDAFIALPTWQGVCIIVAVFVLTFGGFVTVAFIAYVQGQRAAERRLLHFNTKRRNLASIRL